eukprot:Gregarina_sp_Pseudo_9__5401@NODE_661_length_2407_cov_15_393159_g624_i0_p2_GENE_NODE_661_length_2407_cov_15_393159_g624_i0NODE_661_length_2407_cov_15_393159_g624_i0_p2_ORF_typecomplete_len227_score15_76CDPOH_P_transf/PF01066_21/3_1e14CDPOH_P_transf/PF01066_21/3_5e03DUF624/PF04854_14/0_098DUF624/PF04854_14/2_4e03DUF624/PF04854_14/4_4e03_NODE_661_length_2407_cov_15_393159_g624_i0114794
MSHHNQWSPILFYYPNLIGYGRIVLSVATVAVFPSYPWTAAFFYAVSQFLDAVDGHIARLFNQATLLGATMDQLTDRMSTVGIFLLLAAGCPRLTFLFFLIASFDIAGHWIFVYAQALRGTKSHKQMPPTQPLLRWYYETKHVMFVCHLCYETFLFSVLMLSKLSPKRFDFRLVVFLAVITFPLSLFKMWTNVYQLFLGGSLLIQIEEKGSTPSSPLSTEKAEKAT